VKVRITKVTPRLLSTGAPAKLGKSARSLTLSLSASVPSTARITGGAGARSTTLGRKARKLKLRIRPGSKPLVLVFKLRGGGGSATTRIQIPRS
jgi:hypothetical protein